MIWKKTNVFSVIFIYSVSTLSQRPISIEKEDKETGVGWGRGKYMRAARGTVSHCVSTVTCSVYAVVEYVKFWLLCSLDIKMKVIRPGLMHYALLDCF